MKATSAAIKITVCLELNKSVNFDQEKPADLTFLFSLADEIVFRVCCYVHFSHHQPGMKPSLLINNIQQQKYGLLPCLALICILLYVPSVTVSMPTLHLIPLTEY